MVLPSSASMNAATSSSTYSSDALGKSPISTDFVFESLEHEHKVMIKENVSSRVLLLILSCFLEA
jgi:hypothetical protein